MFINIEILCIVILTVLLYNIILYKFVFIAEKNIQDIG